jgi:hypothetical protein
MLAAAASASMAAAMLLVLRRERLPGVALFSAPHWTPHRSNARPRRDPPGERLSLGCHCLAYLLKKGRRALEQMHSSSPLTRRYMLARPETVLLALAALPSAAEMEIR